MNEKTSRTIERTGDLRQVVMQPQGYIGLQELWVCREDGSKQWRWVPTVTMTEVQNGH